MIDTIADFSRMSSLDPKKTPIFMTYSPGHFSFADERPGSDQYEGIARSEAGLGKTVFRVQFPIPGSFSGIGACFPVRLAIFPTREYIK